MQHTARSIPAAVLGNSGNGEPTLRRRSKGNPREVAGRLVNQFEKNSAKGIEYDDALYRLKSGIADCIRDARNARFLEKRLSK